LQMEIWDVDHERRISSWNRRKFAESDNHLDIPTWSPDGARVAVVGNGDLGDDGSRWSSHVHVVDAASGRRILKRTMGEPHRGGTIEALAWSSDRHYLAFGTSEGLTEIVNLDSETAAMTFKAHDGPISALDWSPDGQRLAVAAVDGVVKVIEPRNGNELLTLGTTRNSVTRIAWSPDGQRLAAAAADGAIQVWDASRGYEFGEGGSRSSELAWAYRQQADENVGAAVEDALLRFLELAPQSLDYRSMRGNVLARLGQYDKAAREFRAAHTAQAIRAIDFELYSALALLGARDIDSYRKMPVTRVDTIQDSKGLPERLIVAYLGALIPENVDGFADLVESLKTEAAKNPDPAEYEAAELERHSKRVLGAMLFRLGQYDNAVCTLTDLAAQLDQNQDQTSRYYLACTQFFLAMARHQLGHEFQARRCLHDARAIDQRLQNDPSFDWTRRVILNTLCREAKSLIEP